MVVQPTMSKTPGQPTNFVSSANDATAAATTDSIRLDSVEAAIADIAAGKMVVVVDDEDRENEGDFIFSAELATPELVAFMVRYSSGYVCVGMPEADCDRLGLPPMMARNEDVRNTAYTVTVDAAEGVDTGISATDRAHTLRLLASADSTRATFNRPGHVVPLCAREGGVLVRQGHTEASVDLTRAAGLRPAGVLCEVVSEENPTTMARLPELRRFADKHDLKLISIEQIVQWRRRNESSVLRDAAAELPTKNGHFTAVGYLDARDGQPLPGGTEYVALVAGDVNALNGARDVEVRVHSECLTGDAFGSLRCDCGEQLESALQRFSEQGSGVVIYLRGQEGRGIGLVPKLRAYVLQSQGMDTIDANLHQGYDSDLREYHAAADIIKDLGIESVALMTNNPDKVEQLRSLGIEVSQVVSAEQPPHTENHRYLETKRDRMGHILRQL